MSKIQRKSNKTNITTSKPTNLFAAHHQWSTRPADERFWTIQEAHDACLHYAESAHEASIDLGGVELIETGNNLAMRLENGSTPVLTNWAFGQMARLAGAPADYLRQLPADLTRQCITSGLAKRINGDTKPVKALIHQNGNTVLRAMTSEMYSRIWNYEIFRRLDELQGDGWTVPPARPAGQSDPRARQATEADLLTRSRSFDLSIKAGDWIAPAGIYASDHDMFAFMINENNPIDDGSDGGLARGFFISNSEVGAGSLRVTTFLYRHVCGNHIVWDASDIIELNIRHIGKIRDRFSIEIATSVKQYLDSSAQNEQQLIRRAKAKLLGKTPDEVLDGVFSAISGKRKTGLPSGLNQKILQKALDTAIEHEATDGEPYTVWGFVNGMTRLSQITPFADERVFLDRTAGMVLRLAL